MDMEEPVCEQVIIEEPMPEAAEAAPSAAPKKKFTKRSLVVRPEEAIGDDVVQCCLCGRGFQNLTAKHLLSHGISVDEYKKLCGYVPEQKLICKNLLEKTAGKRAEGPAVQRAETVRRTPEISEAGHPVRMPCFVAYAWVGRPERGVDLPPSGVVLHLYGPRSCGMPVWFVCRSLPLTSTNDFSDAGNTVPARGHDALPQWLRFFCGCPYRKGISQTGDSRLSACSPRQTGT